MSFHNVFKMLYHVFLCLQLDRSQSPFYQSGSANAARPILMQMWISRVARDWNHLIFCRTEASGDWVLEAGAWYLSWAIIFKDFDLCLFSSCHNLDVLRCLLLVDVSLQKHFVSDISMGSRFSLVFCPYMSTMFITLTTNTNLYLYETTEPQLGRRIN